MRRNKLVLGGLALVLMVAAGLALTGCSLSEAKDKAALLAALTEFTAKSTPLGLIIASTAADATTTADGTAVATAIKEGLDGVADEWESVVEKARLVEGADADAAAQAWADLQAAVDTVPEGATAGEAGAIIGDPLARLMAVRDQLNAAAMSAG